MKLSVDQPAGVDPADRLLAPGADGDLDEDQPRDPGVAVTIDGIEEVDQAGDLAGGAGAVHHSSPSGNGSSPIWRISSSLGRPFGCASPREPPSGKPEESA